MAKSLAELRAAAKPRPLERAYTLCLAQDLVSRVQVLATEKTDLQVELGGHDDVDPDKPKRPKRGADPRAARIAEIDAELAPLYEEMRDHEGTLILRAIPVGVWQRWVTDNPPRMQSRDSDGRAIFDPADESIAYGFCDATALLDDLRRYAVSWNDEPVTEADWDYLMESAAPGDVKEICRIVVQLHESVGARAPKALSNSSSTTRTLAAS